MLIYTNAVFLTFTLAVIWLQTVWTQIFNVLTINIVHSLLHFWSATHSKTVGTVKHGYSWKMSCLEGNICCSKISMYFTALMLLHALTQPHGNSLEASFHAWPKAHGIHFFQKWFGITICLTKIYFSTVWWSTQDASEPREVYTTSGHSWHKASVFLHSKGLSAIC